MWDVIYKMSDTEQDRLEVSQHRASGGKNPRTHSFIVRVWQEHRQNSSRLPITRGSVERISDKSQKIFSSVGEMVDFIEQSVGFPLEKGRQR